MNPDVLFFFDGRPRELELYEAFEAAVLARCPGAEIRVQKTQIGFYDGGLFACVSLTPVRRRAERPERFITVTFGLDAPLPEPRALAVQVRENRFTHHVIVGEAGEIDGQLMDWIDRSHELGREKRKNHAGI